MAAANPIVEVVEMVAAAECWGGSGILCVGRDTAVAVAAVVRCCCLLLLQSQGGLLLLLWQGGRNREAGVVWVGDGARVLVGLEEVGGESRHVPRYHHLLRGGCQQGRGRRWTTNCCCSCSYFLRLLLLLLLLLEELQLLEALLLQLVEVVGARFEGGVGGSDGWVGVLSWGLRLHLRLEKQQVVAFGGDRGRVCGGGRPTGDPRGRTGGGNGTRGG